MSLLQWFWETKNNTPLANLVTILGLPAAIGSYIVAKCQDSKHHKELAKKEAMKQIYYFHDSTFNLISRFDNDYQQRMKSKLAQLKKQYPSLSNDDFKKIPFLFSNLKIQCGITKIINELELLAVDINAGYCDDSLIKQKIGHDITKFYQQNEQIINDLNSDADAYDYSNLIKLVSQWDRKEHD